MTQKENETGFAARLLHGAKDLVWQDDPAVRKPAPAAPEVKPPIAVNVRLVASTAPVTNPMATELLSVVMNRPTAYSALAEAIAALSEIPMDEATRYRSAFAVLKKTQQRTVEQIAQAVDVHLSVLESEQVRFSGQSRSAEDGEITARVNEIAALNAAVDQSRTQIDKLRTDTEARIRQLEEDASKKQSRAIELTREVDEKKQAILQTTQQFEAATEAVKKTLGDEKAKIQQYLG